jgi:hypothetical protein
MALQGPKGPRTVLHKGLSTPPEFRFHVDSRSRNPFFNVDRHGMSP